MNNKSKFDSGFFAAFGGFAIGVIAIFVGFLPSLYWVKSYSGQLHRCLNLEMTVKECDEVNDWKFVYDETLRKAKKEEREQKLKEAYKKRHNL